MFSLLSEKKMMPVRIFSKGKNYAHEKPRRKKNTHTAIYSNSMERILKHQFISNNDDGKKQTFVSYTQHLAFLAQQHAIFRSVSVKL